MNILSNYFHKVYYKFKKEYEDEIYCQETYMEILDICLATKKPLDINDKEYERLRELLLFDKRRCRCSQRLTNVIFHFSANADQERGPWIYEKCLIKPVYDNLTWINQMKYKYEEIDLWS